MSAFLENSSVQHLIVGLAIIGAAAGLCAAGTITGTEALGLITGVGGVLLGTTATSVGSGLGSPTPTVVAKTTVQAPPAA